MMIGKAGQQHRSFLTGVPYVQRSCRSRRSRDANMICRHLRQTYTNRSIPIRGGRLNKSATKLDETKYFEQYVVRKRVDCYCNFPLCHASECSLQAPREHSDTYLGSVVLCFLLATLSTISRFQAFV